MNIAFCQSLGGAESIKTGLRILMFTLPRSQATSKSPGSILEVTKLPFIFSFPQPTVDRASTPITKPPK